MIVNIINPQSGVEESCILEFQGELEGELGGEVLGSMNVKENGSVEMSIGLHILEGSIVKLKKPYLVTSKSRTNEGQIEQQEAGIGSLTVENIVRYKILFENRPKPKPLDRL